MLGPLSVSALLWAVTVDRPYNFAHCIFYNVVNNIGWGVIDTTGFSNFGLFFYLSPMTFGKANHLSKKLFIDMA